MIQYHSAKVELSNSQLDKLKSAARNLDKPTSKKW